MTSTPSTSPAAERRLRQAVRVRRITAGIAVSAILATFAFGALAAFTGDADEDSSSADATTTTVVVEPDADSTASDGGGIAVTPSTAVAPSASDQAPVVASGGS